MTAVKELYKHSILQMPSSFQKRTNAVEDGLRKIEELKNVDDLLFGSEDNEIMLNPSECPDANLRCSEAHQQTSIIMKYKSDSKASQFSNSKKYLSNMMNRTRKIKQQLKDIKTKRKVFFLFLFFFFFILFFYFLNYI